MKRLLWLQFREKDQEGIQDLKRKGFTILGRKLRITLPAIGWWWRVEAPEETPSVFNSGEINEFLWKG